METRQMTHTVASLFSGCGGFDLGFEKAGFEIRFACDNDPTAVDTYNRNLAQGVAECLDVQATTFRKRITELGSVDVVLGGFPCQGFSKAGPKLESDSRNSLYLEMLLAVKLCNPSVFVAENVDGLSQNFSGKYRQKIQSDFEALGYAVESRVLDAASFGVPQHRRRIFFVGIRDDIDFIWPGVTHFAGVRNGESRLLDDSNLWSDEGSRSLAPAVTIREAISDLIDLGDSQIADHRIADNWPDKYRDVFKAIGPGQKLCNVRHSATSVYTWDIPSVFGRTSASQRLILDVVAKNRRHKRYGSIPNGNPIPLDEVARLTGIVEPEKDIERLLEMGYLKSKLNGIDLKGAMFCSGLFKRPIWDAPAPTILTNFHNPRYFLHPSEDRPFSLRECARLQGFPDTFEFGSETSKKALLEGYRLVGNAVPPPIGQTIAEACRNALSQSSTLEVTV